MIAICARWKVLIMRGMLRLDSSDFQRSARCGVCPGTKGKNEPCTCAPDLSGGSRPAGHGPQAGTHWCLLFQCVCTKPAPGACVMCKQRGSLEPCLSQAAGPSSSLGLGLTEDFMPVGALSCSVSWSLVVGTLQTREASLAS